MMFVKDEKVFSLARTAAAVPQGDLTALMEEFYCYLLVAGLFREGEPISNNVSLSLPISSEFFTLTTGSYNSGLGSLISKGLKDRYDLIIRSPSLTDHDVRTLTAINTLFTNDYKLFSHLTGKDLISLAYTRQFSDVMKTVAHYVAVAFGQSDYPQSVLVPRFYLSVFGNIHLAKPESAQVSGPTSHQTILEAPLLPYGAMSKQGDTVTALWALLSAQVASLAQYDSYQSYSGDYLGDILSSFAFLSNPRNDENSIPLPAYASSLYLQRMMGLDEFNALQPSALFYRDFLYSSIGELKVSRQSLLLIIINLMMEKMGESNLDHLFSDRSFYRKLTVSTLYTKKVKRPTMFQFALEALAGDQEKESTSSTDDSSLSQDTSLDATETDNSSNTIEGYDPSTPPPQSPVSISDPDSDKDTIDLISFNKTGEGVNEDLYRQAVVVLNDRLKTDDTLPVSADTKDALNFWVNGFLYRTAIQATKDHIQSLNLQAQLKNISTKG